MQISSSLPQAISQPTPMPTSALKPAPPPDSSDDTAALSRVSDLIATLQTTPPVRPETVERGMALVADPSYPPAELIQKLAGLIVDTSAGES
jgi:hypothetical protein